MNQIKSFFALSALLLLIYGCSGTTLARISVDETLPETRVEGVGITNILPLTLSSMALDVTSAEAYASEEFDYTTEIKIRSLAFSITDSSTDHNEDAFEDGIDDNFDFISSLDLYIKATIDGEEKQTRIAYLGAEDSQIGSGASQLSLSVENVDILSYVEADGGYEVLVNATGEVPPDAVVFDGQIVYRVGIGFD